MPRKARVVLAGFPHHVTQRGNNRQRVFVSDQDYLTYLKALAKQCPRYGLRLLGYCLMPNHVHLVAVPEGAKALGLAVGRAHLTVARRINDRLGRSGHLWQARYYSCPFDWTHLQAVMHYVERNPVRAGIVAHAWEWPWSSAAAHAGRGGVSTSEILDEAPFAEHCPPEEWRALLESAEGETELRRIRATTKTGRPWMPEHAVRAFERTLGRRLRPRPRGRPRSPDK